MMKVLARISLRQNTGGRLVEPILACAQLRSYSGFPARTIPQWQAKRYHRRRNGLLGTNLNVQFRNVGSVTRETIGPQTHYEFFPETLGAGAVPPSGPFVIDLKALKKEFLKLQGKAHPDMQPTGQKKQAEALSARINEAYKTLQNPLLRAQYLLGLRGIDVAENETEKVDDMELLMEVLETRETIEDAESEGDLDPLKEKNEDRISTSEKILEDCFKSVKLRYWINIRQSIDDWEQGKPVVLSH
jgi:molecular chaperone HscB